MHVYVEYKLYIISFHSECGCNVLGSNSLQCLEDGSCVCNEGVKGTKCDSCIENYFLQEMTGQCTSEYSNIDNLG